MTFTYEELAYLNQMISIALISGQIEYDDISKEVHRKVTEEIVKRNTEVEQKEETVAV